LAKTKISLLTLFPDLYKNFLDTSLVKRAQDNSLVNFELVNLFNFTQPKKRIDSPTYGHNSGMLIKPEIAGMAIDQQEKKHGKAFKIFLSPKGQKLDQKLSLEISKQIKQNNHLLLFSSRYEGIDARVEEVYADLEVSIGDYILMGGDLPAMVLLESVLRHLPNVIGKQESVDIESFTGPFVEHPEYTTPVKWKNLEVPEIVRSGNHLAIKNWQLDQAAKRSVLNNFDWIRSYELSLDEKLLASKYIPSHYIVLMHDQVLLKNGEPGTTSVTSLDLHDIARSAATYGVKNYYIVTPLKDQQKIVKTLLDFWHSDSGKNYNKHRHKAVSRVKVKASLDEVLEDIKTLENLDNKNNITLISTSAKKYKNKTITYFDQKTAWANKNPVLLLFGTGHGLSSEILEKSNYILGPVSGFSDFNHLSVRSAAAIVLDRWLGLNIKT